MDEEDEEKVYSLFRPPFHYQSGKQRKKLSALPFFNFPLAWAFFVGAFSGSTLCEDDFPGCDNSGQESDSTNCSPIRWWMQRLLVVVFAIVSVVFGFDWNIKLVFVFITSLSRVPSKVLQRDWIELFDCSQVNCEECFSWIRKLKRKSGRYSTIKRLGEINSIGILINFSSLIGKLLLKLDESRFTCKSIEFEFDLSFVLYRVQVGLNNAELEVF